MLEDRSCLVSRGYPITCEAKNNTWACMNCRQENGKRPLEIDDDDFKEELNNPKRPSKQSDLSLIFAKEPMFSSLDLNKPLNQSDFALILTEEPKFSSVDLNESINQSDLALILTEEPMFSSVDLNEPPNQSDLSLILTEEPMFSSVDLNESSNESDFALNSTEEPMLSPVDQNESSNQPNLALALSSTDENQSDNDSTSDSHSLISGIGRDNSISCLIHCSRADYGSIASVNSSFRSLVRNGELYRLRRKLGVIEHWVYISCNLLEWDAFDPNRRKWMRLPRMHSNECFFFSDKESLAVGTELLVFGKEIMSNVIYKYSLLTNAWSSGMMMNYPRCLFGSASLGEVAILAGGCDSLGNALASAELYNSENGVWETLPDMHKTRKMCSSVFMDGKYYVIGGVGGKDVKLLTCGEEYDLEKKIWTEIPNMSPVRAENEVAATSEAPPLVAVVGNELYSADHARMELRKYDKGSRVWVTIGRLPERAASMNGWGLAFRACGDRVICIGGPRVSGPGFIEVNSWVPSEGPPEWTLLSRKQSASFVYNCAVMGC